MSRTTVMWKTIQSPPSAIQLTFALPAPRTEGAVGVSSKHHYLLLLGDLPAHCYALGFTQQSVWSAADVMDPSRVEHPSMLEQGPSSMAHIPRVYQGLNGPCATCAMKRVVGQTPGSVMWQGTPSLRSPAPPLRAVPFTSSPQITCWVRQFEPTCNFPAKFLWECVIPSARKQQGTGHNEDAKAIQQPSPVHLHSLLPAGALVRVPWGAESFYHLTSHWVLYSWKNKKFLFSKQNSKQTVLNFHYILKSK